MAGPAEIVTSAYETYSALAQTSLDKTLDYISDLSSYQLPTVTIDAPVFATPTFASLTSPAEPSPPGGITPVLPATPESTDVEPPDLVDTAGVPELSASEPTLTMPPVPGALTAEPPADPAAQTPPTLPTLTDPALPISPSLVTLTIPNAPVLNLPTFGEPIPDFTLDFNIGEFSYNETIYNSALLDTLRGRITDMVSGGTGLPPAIEQALFDRARGREASVNLAATQTALEDWSSRGFTMPGGDISRRLAEVREARRTAENTLQRETLLQIHTAALEQLKAGVASGVQLEGELMNYMGGYAQRALEAAKAVVELSVAVLNARIAFFNAQLQRVTIAAQVYETQVRAALATVEIYKAQVEAERVRGEINVQAVQLYQAQINAALSVVEIYKAKLEGTKTQVDIQRNTIEIYKARVEAYGTLVQAKKTEYDGYTAAIQGETAKAGLYNTLVQAFAARVDAYGKRVDAQVRAAGLKVEVEKLKVEQFDSKVRAYTAEVGAEIQRVQALIQLYGDQIEQYKAAIGFSEASARINVAQADVAVNAGNAQTQIATQAAIAQAQIALQASAQVMEAIKAAAAISSQLAAGAMSAVHTGAQIEGSESTNYNLTGDSPSPPAA